MSFTQVPDLIIDSGELDYFDMIVAVFIARKTMGWGKQTDGISRSQFCDALKMSKVRVKKSLDSLISKNIISMERQRRENGGYSYNSFGFTKHFIDRVNSDRLARSSSDQGVKSLGHQVMKPRSSGDQGLGHQVMKQDKPITRETRQDITSEKKTTFQTIAKQKEEKHSKELSLDSCSPDTVIKNKRVKQVKTNKELKAIAEVYNLNGSSQDEYESFLSLGDGNTPEQWAEYLKAKTKYNRPNLMQDSESRGKQTKYIEGTIYCDQSSNYVHKAFADYELSPTKMQWEDLTASFDDYYANGAGVKQKRKDWIRSFQTWVRRDLKSNAWRYKKEVSQ